jgi:hypothetical protein
VFSAVLPSIGLGSLSAREAEGRTNISARQKVLGSYFYLLSYHLCVLWINMMAVVLTFAVWYCQSVK